MLAHLLPVLQAYGVWGLLILAFAESSFFPVFPDFILIPLCLANPEQAVFYALLATVGSATGAYFGYVLGNVVGQPLLRRLASGEKIALIEKTYQKYGAWAVCIAGLAPLPYKLFTISSGIFRLSLPGFLTATLLGRGLRFFAEAILIMSVGEQAIVFIRTNSGWLSTIIISGIIILLMLFFKRQSVSNFLLGLRDKAGLARISKGRIMRSRLQLLGEWLVALGSGAFLSFFLAGSIKDILNNRLFNTDQVLNQLFAPVIGPAWKTVDWLFNGWVLFLLVILSSYLFLRKEKWESVVFLFLSLIGSSTVLWGFYRIIMENYSLNPFSSQLFTHPTRVLINTLWACYIIWLSASRKTLWRKEKLVKFLSGILVLLLLGISRVSAGFRPSEVVVTLAIAGLWSVVVWIIFLYRHSLEEK